MKRACLALLLFTAACDREVGRTYGQAYTETRSVSCTYTGFCYSCFGATRGTSSCGFKLSSLCSGTRQAEVAVLPYETVYESGTKRRYEDTRVVRNLTACGSTP